MKNRIIIQILLLMICANVHATIFINENWDSGTPPTYWPCTSQGNCPSAFNGWAPQSYSCIDVSDAGARLSGLSSSIYYSYPRSYHQVRNAGEINTCDIWHAISGGPTKIYIRFYVYFPSSWTGYDVPNLSPMTHFIFLDTAYSMTGLRWNFTDHVSHEWAYECPGASGGEMFWAIQDYDQEGQHGTAPLPCYDFSLHTQEWICIEVMADAANDLYAMWINGTQYVGSGGNGVSSRITPSSFNSIAVSGYSNLGESWSGDFYIDDMVVSDEYIGPLGVTTTTTSVAADTRKIFFRQ